MQSLQFGSPSLPPLVFLHANGYPPAAYTPLLRRLGEHFFVRAPFQRPLWPQSDPQSLKDWKPLSQDLLDFLEETGPAVVAGHSMGGIAALRGALLRPESFRALALLDPVLFPPLTIAAWNFIRLFGLGEGLHPLINTAKKRRRAFDDLERLFNGYRRRRAFRYFSDEALRVYVQAIACPCAQGGWQLCYSPEWEVRIYLTGISPDLELWRGLKHLRPPTLIVRGAETDTFLPAAARQVARLNPAIAIHTLERSTHLLPLECPEQTAALLAPLAEPQPAPGS